MKRSILWFEIGLVVVLFCPGLASADYYGWVINEVYSSADGKVQFIELFTQEEDQRDLQWRTITSYPQSLSPPYFPERSIMLDSGLEGDTAGKTVLIATQEFANRTGLMPDYFMPEKFLPVSGGALTLDGIDGMEIIQPQFPLNGEQSLDGDGQLQAASPKNFQGETVALSVPPLATLDQSFSSMTIPVVDVPGIGIANIALNVDLQSLSFSLGEKFYFYAEGIVAGSAPAGIEPDNQLYIPNLELGSELLELRLDLVAEDPITFANVDIINVTAAPEDINSDPAPNWAISELFSTADGRIQFIELITSGANEQNLEGVALASGNSFNALPNFFNFPSDLEGDTRNRSLLLATEGFAEATGLDPDFVLPDNFFPVGGVPVALDFNAGADRVYLRPEIMPLNGRQSANRISGLDIATPTNFAGETAVVHIEPVAVYRPESNSILLPELVRRENELLGQTLSVNLEKLLFYPGRTWVYKKQILASDNPAELNNDGWDYYIPSLHVGNELFEVTLEWKDEESSYGNLVILSVRPED